MARALARRYAHALAEVLFGAEMAAAKKTKVVQQTKVQLETFTGLLASHAGLRNTLASPAVPMNQKLAVIDGLKKKLGWDTTLRNFIAVLIENRRLDELNNVIESFDEEVYVRAGIVPIGIISAVSLSAADKKDLEKQLKKIAGSEVELRYQRDESILGGAVARMGDTIFDGSLRAHLERLGARLAER